MMAEIFILVAFLILGYGLGWLGHFRLIILSGSRTERVLENIHLTGITLLSLIVITLPPLTEFHGRPELAYSALALLLLSLALFPLRIRSLVLSFSPATGARAKPAAEQGRSRWPHSFTWIIAYCLVAWYVATIFGKFGT
jgi:hypothetical protein